MRQVEVHGPDDLRIVDRPSRALDAGEVRIKVAAIGVNYLDIQERTGVYPREFPYVPGGEGSGIITELAGDVDGLRVGQRVCWQGVRCSYAEAVVAPVWKVLPVPDEVSDQEAAAILLQGLTAQYLATTSYAIQPGDVVVIHAGAGGLGLLLTQVAKLRGARVITTVSSTAKAVLSLEAGADLTVPYDELTTVAAGNAAVVYDSVGQATFEDSLTCLKKRGTLVLLGQSSGPVPPFDLSRLGRLGSLTITRPTLSDFVSTPAELHDRASAVFNWLATGRLRLRIGATYPLTQTAEAHAALEARSTTGKVLLIP
ncbi:NADPH2:quinone reductase [Kribbella voronezhensis]|uniref:NADPH2:quinone reductase n=1 Tax=Kribbella voronezhensis TaxID=2512212 RepID=A0A4R7T721_9ACTN|nr:quinone oxidoreductase [Kribbella voronezhensis]TDU87674.1 NADPH2:quinone reductase [Kribbella voronezhensis]